MEHIPSQSLLTGRSTLIGDSARWIEPFAIMSNFKYAYPCPERVANLSLLKFSLLLEDGLRGCTASPELKE